jgi:NAD+ kinase
LNVSQVGLVLHPHHDSSAIVHVIAGWAHENRARICGLEGQSARLPPDACRRPEEDLARSCDFVIAVGGDGTMLRALAIAAPHEVPVFGVRLGSRGFLAEVDAGQVALALRRLSGGEWVVEERLALAVSAWAHVGVGLHDVAYNDVVIRRGTGSGPIVIKLLIDGHPFTGGASDGLVVSTPTGSTAYNFAAGGPIVSPRLQGMVLTALAPQWPVNRSLVVHPSERVYCQLDANTPASVEVDGGEAGRLEPHDILEIHSADRPGRVLRLADANFYRQLLDRMPVLGGPERLRGALPGAGM